MKTETQNDKPSLGNEIRKVWSKITDEEVALFEKQPEKFFEAVKTKHNVSKEDAQKRLKEIQTACGSCGTTQKAAA